MEQPRELTFAERATWGTCSICGAEDGEWCYAEIGLQLGCHVDGSRMRTGEGVHASRLIAAPTWVRLIPCSSPE
jgi:hypothetical protein